MIVGHVELRAELARLLLEGRLPSTLLFAGPKGIGKSLVANAFAKQLLCEHREDPHCSCPSCVLFENGNHPDLMRLDCKTAEEQTEQVREILRRLSLKGFVGKARVVVLDHAESMSLQSANILLKSLEEPRPNVYFVLVTSNATRLPATLLSRCHRYAFRSLTIEELKSLTIAHPELIGVPLELCDGSLERARILTEVKEEIPVWKAALRSIALGDLGPGLELATELGKQKDLLPRNMVVLRALARSLLHEFSSDHHMAARFALLLSNILEAEKLLFDRNMNATYLLPQVFLSLSRGIPLTITEQAGVL